MATVYKWDKRGNLPDLMIRKNYCYYHLGDGIKTPFYKFNTPGATATEAAEDLNDQLDCISEGVVIVTMQVNEKKKQEFDEFKFNIAPLNNTQSIGGLPKEYISEKIEAAIFKNTTELNQKFNDDRAKWERERNEIILQSNSGWGDKLYSMIEASPFAQNHLLKIINKVIGDEPIANISGVDDNTFNRITKHIPEPFFNDLLSKLADQLDADKVGTIKKLQSVFSNAK